MKRGRPVKAIYQREDRELLLKDPNDYIGSVFVWEEQKVKEIMQDIVKFTKQSNNNIKWK